MAARRTNPCLTKDGRPKTVYHTHAAAQEAIDGLIRGGAYPYLLRAYICRTCGNRHIGHFDTRPRRRGH